MKKLILFTLILTAYMFVDSSSQTLPLVYSAENTGANDPIPYMAPISGLTKVVPLPDPFQWADGRGRYLTIPIGK